ncbi:MAG: 50S ribosomal protein L31e [Thermoprotei archaeon]|nr:MAG: 50S ribosomal protein L31e [Thermoprotei archaeon]
MSEEEKVVLEREYVIPLRKVYEVPRKKRAKVAVRVVKEFVLKHVKPDDVYISNKVNEKIWEHSVEKPPRRIKVIVRKVEIGEGGEKLSIARVFLPEEVEEEQS